MIKSLIKTPAFIINERALLDTLSFLADLRFNTGCLLLYSLKSFALPSELEMIVKTVDGFSASSYFEARLAREIIKSNGSIHFTTPGVKVDEIERISHLCDFISFNSLSQWRRFYNLIESDTSLGLRVNPLMSVIQDERYDPCRRHSKLGIPIDYLAREYQKNHNEFNEVQGLHIHANSESKSAEPLLANVKHLILEIGDLLNKIQWINLGGGYSYHEMESLQPFYEAVELLHQKYHLDVYIEPGEAVIGRAAHMLSTVVDMFDNHGKTIAILDTTINHMPEIFEFQYQPDIQEHAENGKYRYILAGSTCLAGDLFGEYSFDLPLKVGSQVTFENTGAYTLVKAHMFNGVNLPSIYTITEGGEFILRKKYEYEDFKMRWEEKSNESL